MPKLQLEIPTRVQAELERPLREIFQRVPIQFPETAGETICQSLSPVLAQYGERSSILSTWVSAPGFTAQEPYTLHAWPVLMDVPCEQGSHLKSLTSIVMSRPNVSRYRGRFRYFEFGDFAQEVTEVLLAKLRDPTTGFAAK